MIIEQVISPELLDQHARVLGKSWKKYVNYGLGPVLLGGGIVVGARSTAKECIGLVWATRTKDPMTLYFGNIHVSKEHRRRGVAKVLETEICRLAVADGARWGFSLAEIWNTKSDEFIRRQGWVRFGTVLNCYWSDDPTHFYYKDLLSTKLRPPFQSVFWSKIYALHREKKVTWKSGRIVNE